MPRGQKSKHRARERRRRAREEAKNVKDDQAVTSEEEQPSSSTSPLLEAVPGKSSAAEAMSGEQEPESASSAGAAGASGDSHTGLEEGASSKVDVRENLFQEKVSFLVQYLLYKYQIKEPVTKTEMLKNVIQECKHNFTEILKKAADHLELIFGLDLKEVDPFKNIYFLINKLEPNQDTRSGERRSIPTTGLLMTILGVIFTNGNRASEEQVWGVLNMIGIYEGIDHFLFGDPKLLIRDLVRQGYLKYEQIPNSVPPRYELLWGPRAYAETTKMKVLEFSAKIHNSPPSAIQPWYDEALKDEEERAQARVAARAHSAAVATSCSKAKPTSSSFSRK
ncbi:melanoma-associated antigen B10 [Ctenodactylus gundi]